jgi:hypothetical protein
VGSAQDTAVSNRTGDDTSFNIHGSLSGVIITGNWDDNRDRVFARRGSTAVHGDRPTSSAKRKGKKARLSGRDKREMGEARRNEELMCYTRVPLERGLPLCSDAHGSVR